MQAEFEALDELAVAIYLEVPGRKVVLFQAFFESYEGLGVVRTIDIQHSRVCIVTTRDMLEACEALLERLKPEIPWRYVEKPTDSEKLFGYTRKG